MPTKAKTTSSSVYIVDGARTPFIKAKNKPGLFTASDLAVAACQPLLARQSFLPSDFDEVVTGCAMPSADEANISRVISLRIGCGKTVPAFTVQRNCASGLQAIDSAAQLILLGRRELMLAGGVDSMSHCPLYFKEEMAAWFGAWASSKTFMQKLQVLSQLRPSYFAPIIALLRGLTDPIVGLSMGQTAENLAYRFNITRKDMDEFAARSQQRLAKAQAENIMTEIETLYDHDGNIYNFDDGVRPDSSVENLAKLKPFFDKKFGSVTAGNSSQVTDGAAFIILASEDAVKKYNLPVLGRLVDVAWAGCDPAEMGLGPVYSSNMLLQKHHLKLDDIDYWEINEAFAAQVIACVKAFDDEKFCQDQLGLKEKLGRIDENKLNIYGGAIGIGHPIGASGARVVLQLLHILKRNKAKRGIATLCIGGGQGGAALIENIEE